jgi:hypothetical protein
MLYIYDIDDIYVNLCPELMFDINVNKINNALKIITHWGLRSYGTVEIIGSRHCTFKFHTRLSSRTKHWVICGYLNS